MKFSFPNFEADCYSMFSSNCCFLTCIQVSQEAGQEFWYSHLLKNFPQFIVIHTVKGFGTKGHCHPRASSAGENARSWEALGEARPGQSSLSAGSLRYRAWAHSWSSAALAAGSVLPSNRPATISLHFCNKLGVHTGKQRFQVLRLRPHSCWDCANQSV